MRYSVLGTEEAIPNVVLSPKIKDLPGIRDYSKCFMHTNSLQSHNDRLLYPSDVEKIEAC